MKKYIFAFINVLIIANTNLFAVSVRNYNIAPLNRVTIYFDKMPTISEEKLTQDKRMLDINLGEVDFTPAQQSIVGDGIIKKVELIKKNKNTFLTLSLADARGYNIAKLPYSMGLIVEVFDWKQLDSAEEAYRMGLLSLIDDEVELAEVDLLKGVNGGIGDAGFFLGSIKLEKGKINTALKLFHFADFKKTSINDNYIALNQIYIHKKQNDKAEKYAKIYKANTGNTTIPTIQFPQITETGELSEPLPHIDSVLNTEQNLVDFMPDDTTKIDTNKVAGRDTTAVKNEESIWEAENYLLIKYAVGIAIALILFVVYLYLKWRNKQLRAIEEYKISKNKQQKSPTAEKKNKADFNKLMNEKMKEHKSIKKSPTAKIVSQQPNEENNKGNQNGKSTSTTKPDYKKNANDLLNFIDKIKKEDVIVKSDSVVKSELEVANFKASKSSSTINRTNTANVDLASRLLNEQKKMKQEKLSNLSKTEKLTPEKIDEVAKKIGISKGSLETKQNLDKLQNEDELKKLREKFGIKKH